MRRNSRGLFAAVAVLVGLVAVPTVVRSAEQPPAIVLVHGSNGSADAAVAALRELALPVTHRMDAIGVVVTAGSADALADLAADARIQRVEAAPPAPEFHLATSLQAIRLNDAATLKGAGPKGPIPYDGSGIGIAVIDTGVDATHPMFALPDGTSSVVRNLEVLCVDQWPSLILNGQAVPGNVDACGEAGVDHSMAFVDTPAGDSDGVLGGHGTHVASTAAGQPVTTADGRHLQGVAPGARIISLAVTQEAGTSWAGIAALNWVAENHKAPCGDGVPAATCPPIRVVNNSWGYPQAYDPDSALDKAAAAVLDAGVVIAWSAGNDGEDEEGKEAMTNGVTHTPRRGLLSVASYNDSDQGSRNGLLSGFSSRGLKGSPDTYPDLSAPGDAITAACRPWLTICSTGADTRDPDYNTISGTSMAAPHVAGAMAVLLQARPDLTPPDVHRILQATSYKFRTRGAYEADAAHPGGSTSYDKGHGLIDLAAALGASTGRLAPAPSSPPVVFRPAAAEGAARIGEDHEWQGGPVAGVNISGCGPYTARLGECEHETVRADVPSSGADLSVSIDPAGSPIGVEIYDPDGHLIAGDYYVDTVGEKTLETWVFKPGVYTVSVFAETGGSPTYSGLFSLSEPVEE